MNLDLVLALRATEAKRWTIVRLTREQSVAEHQYRVWLIARAMYEAMFSTPHNSSDMWLLESMALTHDLHEVITGDIPSTVKESNAEIAAAVRAAEEDARRRMGLPSMVAHRGTVPARVLRMADCAEALLFLFQNGGRDRPEVWANAHARYARAYFDAMGAHGHQDWQKAHKVVLGMAGQDAVWEQVMECRL